MAFQAVELSPVYCRQRQARMFEQMNAEGVDRVLLVSRANIQYFTGVRLHRLMEAALCLDLEQGVVLAAPNSIPDNVAADDVVVFPAQHHATLRQDQSREAVQRLLDRVGKGSSTQIGIEGSMNPAVVAIESEQRLKDIDSTIWKLRRCKDPDELLMIEAAICCTEAMYNAAREIIEPGITELEVYQQLHSVGVVTAGEPLWALGNDFQCNSPGGPPRLRKAGVGELFILDLGPCYRGYYADNCRTISVDGKPTDEQFRAWQAITQVLELVEAEVKPGVSCAGLFDLAQEMLDAYRPGAFFHHLGHGFGLFPHEAPRLNRNWDETFEVGDVFTAEPGLYSDELKAGIRLEQDYVVTTDGVRRLTNFALDL